MGDRYATRRPERDATAAAVEGQYRRAERCAGCGMAAGSGLGDHYFGCPIDTAARAARDVELHQRAFTLCLLAPPHVDDDDDAPCTRCLLAAATERRRA
jgi:hypothetical protein